MTEQTQDTRPLIEIAREFVEAVRAHEITDARLDEARARAYALGMTSQFDAQCYVRGYDTGHSDGHNDGYGDGYEDAVEAVPKKWEAHTRQVQQANDRLRARIAELEEQLAARPTVDEQQQPTGIVVDYAMRERAAVAYYDHISFVGAHRVHEWMPHVLTAALTSAKTVPLARVEPVWWMGDGADVWQDRSAAVRNSGDVAPLYVGLAQLAQDGTAREDA